MKGSIDEVDEGSLKAYEEANHDLMRHISINVEEKTNIINSVARTSCDWLTNDY